jgi:hypothetical protein
MNKSTKGINNKHSLLPHKRISERHRIEGWRRPKQRYKEEGVGTRNIKIADCALLYDDARSCWILPKISPNHVHYLHICLLMFGAFRIFINLRRGNTIGNRNISLYNDTRNTSLYPLVGYIS